MHGAVELNSHVDVLPGIREDGVFICKSFSEGLPVNVQNKQDGQQHHEYFMVRMRINVVYFGNNLHKTVHIIKKMHCHGSTISSFTLAWQMAFAP